MEIVFRVKKLQKQCNSDVSLLKAFGKDNCRKIKLRLAVLRAAETLEQISTNKPERCHQLSGNRNGQFAVDLSHPFRLLFEPNHDPLPKMNDGGLDKSKVTSITILTVEDYH